jgi:hypothetical protein
MSPTRKPFLLAFAEDIGIEPNTRRYISLSRRTLSPSRFIFHRVWYSCSSWGSHTIYSPFCAHDGLRSHYLLCIRQVLYQLSYMSDCGQGRVRSYNPRINSTMLSQLSYLSFLLWGQMELNHQDDVLQTRSGPCRYPLCTLYRDRTCDLLYVRQPLLPSELRVLVLVLLNKSNHFLV